MGHKLRTKQKNYAKHSIKSNREDGRGIAERQRLEGDQLLV